MIPRWTTKKGSTTRCIEKSCMTCGSVMLVRLSIATKKFCSIACRNNDPEYLEMLLNASARSAQSRDFTGSKNPNWRGGRTVARASLMAKKPYKDWRKGVYERDNYQCVECGVLGDGRNLNADHIKPYATHPELALDIDNGRTLCIDCHKMTDTYGWKMFNQLRKVEASCQV